MTANNTDNDLQQKARPLLGELTLEEKIHLLHGGFYSGGIKRLGIGPFVCADGPLGVRRETLEFDPSAKGNSEVENNGLAKVEFQTTAMPSTIGLAATFDLDAACRYAKVIAEQCLAAGIHCILGPGMNLLRDPRCGRHFEYLGEDPHLAAEISVSYINALQDKKIAACAKHYYANDVEFRRHYTSSNLSQRCAWELHLHPFVRSCKDANVWTVMTGNNLVEGKYISENPQHLKGVLRDVLSWDGVVLTDWRAAYTPAGSVAGGLDMTTGFCRYVFGDGRLMQMVKDGEIPVEAIDQMAENVLLLYARVGMLDETKLPRTVPDLQSHNNTAREIAAASMVLLKNKNKLLPIGPAQTQCIILTGPALDSVEHGGGSGKVVTDDIITPREGITNAFAGCEVICETDAAKIPALVANTDADAVIYLAKGPYCTEGADIEEITLPDGQAEQISVIGKSCSSRLIVAIQCATAMDISAINDSAAAILIAWLGGQALGAALADVITGKVNPSAKLPCSFARSLDDYPCSQMNTWPAKLILDHEPPAPGHTPEQRRVLHAYDANYEEGVFIGYRWFQHKQIDVLYPFGHGLSYTSFELAEPTLHNDNDSDSGDGNFSISGTLTNTGHMAGAEVIQLYVHQIDPTIERPVSELKAFERLQLSPGQSGEYSFELSARDFAYYDESISAWRTQAGNYELQIGTSSENIAHKVPVKIDSDIVITR